MTTYVPQKGDFIAVTFDPQSGHEQRGRRPALVVSNTLFNKHTGLAIVCPLTNTERRFPFHVAVAMTQRSPDSLWLSKSNRSISLHVRPSTSGGLPIVCLKRFSPYSMHVSIEGLKPRSRGTRQRATVPLSFRVNLTMNQTVKMFITLKRRVLGDQEGSSQEDELRLPGADVDGKGSCDVCHLSGVQADHRQIRRQGDSLCPDRSWPRGTEPVFPGRSPGSRGRDCGGVP